MSCECHQIGGRFIAEDPDCPAHGREAQLAARERDEIISFARTMLQYGTQSELADAYGRMLRYLESQ